MHTAGAIGATQPFLSDVVCTSRVCHNPTRPPTARTPSVHARPSAPTFSQTSAPLAPRPASSSPLATTRAARPPRTRSLPLLYFVFLLTGSTSLRASAGSNPVRIQSPSPDLLGPARVQQWPSRVGPLGPIQWILAQFDRGPSELPRPSPSYQISACHGPARLAQQFLTFFFIFLIYRITPQLPELGVCTDTRVGKIEVKTQDRKEERRGTLNRKSSSSPTPVPLVSDSPLQLLSVGRISSPTLHSGSLSR
ncbi:hypothetical protein CRG98_031921 [Punica granatum]|uniref:Uncharacterized protein n=1 Tax=Punica granatum TaxID=22663 RepID=A0A2I0IUL5_PUNGR|nr:hypothetical protein CRG98_031921 [Punica granatum]